MNAEKNRILLKKKSLGYAVRAGCFPGIICVFSTRAASYDIRHAAGAGERAGILRRRRIFFRKWGVNPQNAVYCGQTHGTKAHRAESPERGKGARHSGDTIAGCDALITSERGLALCVFTADCFPLVLIETKRKIIGIVHAGWRGTAGGIIRKTIALMRREYACRPEETSVIIGPGIRGCCYRVGAGLKHRFSGAVYNKGKELFLDLVKANIRQIRQAGVKKSRIFDTKLCTSCRNGEFFSYRRGDGQKRMLSFVMLRTQKSGKEGKAYGIGG